MIVDAAGLGIRFRSGSDALWLYYRGDAEDPKCPPAPGRREMLCEQAKRIGLATYGYQPEAGPPQVAAAGWPH